MSSKYRRKGKGHFVQLHEWMMKSQAWAELDVTARAIYVELKRRYDGFNNGRIGLGCREAAEATNVSKSSANRAFDTLLKLGFIRVSKLSGFNVKNRVATQYALTELVDNVTGELPTKDFMRWPGQSQPSDRSKNSRSQNQAPRSHHRDCDTHRTPSGTPHSPTTGTVKPDLPDPQSHQRDTYRYTTGG